MKQYFTMQKLEMMNGKVLDHTLAFIRLNKVSKKYPEVFKKYCAVRNLEEEPTELDYATILYTAYLCANADKEEVLTEEEYLNILPTNRKLIITYAIALTYPSKN